MSGQADNIISILVLTGAVLMAVTIICFRYYDYYKQRLIEYHDQFKNGEKIDFYKSGWQIVGVSIFQKIPPYKSNEDFYAFEKTLDYYETLNVLKKAQYILLTVIALLVICIAIISLLK